MAALTPALTPNRKAFLETITLSELGAPLVAVSDEGYDVIVTSTAADPILFKRLEDGTPDYSDHPRRSMYLPRLGIHSTAAGAFQILEHYFDVYKKQLELPDFGPMAQQAIAIQMIRECRALELVDSGNFDAAVLRCNSRWASLPGAGYGQHENKFTDLRAAYAQAGGRFEDIA